METAKLEPGSVTPLGPVEAVFEKVTTPLERGKALYFCVVIPLSCLLIPLGFVTIKPLGWDEPVAIFRVLGPAAVVVGCFLIDLARAGEEIRRVWRDFRCRDLKVALCAEGLLALRNGRPSEFRWDDVVSCRARVGEGPLEPDEYTLSTADGRRLTFDDRIGGTGELVLAGGGALFAMIRDAITPRLVTRALAEIDTAGSASFGPVSVGRRGLRIKGEEIPWDGVERYRLHTDALALFLRRPGAAKLRRVLVRDNPFVLNALLDRIGAHAPRGEKAVPERVEVELVTIPWLARALMTLLTLGLYPVIDRSKKARTPALLDEEGMTLGSGVRVAWGDFTEFRQTARYVNNSFTGTLLQLSYAGAGGQPGGEVAFNLRFVENGFEVRQFLLRHLPPEVRTGSVQIESSFRPPPGAV